MRQSRKSSAPEASRTSERVRLPRVEDAQERVLRMAAGLAHELNNQLTPILGNAALVQRAIPQNAPEREAIDDLILATRRAAYVARAMLTFTGRAATTLARTTAAALTQPIAEVYRDEGVASVSWRVEENLALRVDVDQLRGALAAMLDNATQASPGRDAITVTLCAVDASEIDADVPWVGALPEAGPLVWLEVSDRGVGVAPEHLAQVFDPFFTTRPPAQGLGLSLAIGVARAHGGAMRAISEPGRGTQVQCVIPHEMAAVHESGARPAARGDLVVVERDAHLRAMLVRVLGRLGSAAAQVEDLSGVASSPDVVVASARDDDPAWEPLLAAWMAARPNAHVVLLCERDAARPTLPPGRIEVVPKPFSLAALRVALERAQRRGAAQP